MLQEEPTQTPLGTMCSNEATDVIGPASGLPFFWLSTGLLLALYFIDVSSSSYLWPLQTRCLQRSARPFQIRAEIPPPVPLEPLRCSDIDPLFELF